MRIAVVENSNLRTTSILEPGLIAVYEYKCGKWKVIRRFENPVCRAGTIAQLRTSLDAVIRQFDGAVIVAAREIPGLALSIIEEAGLGISLTDDPTADILDPIRNELLAVMQNQPEKLKETDIKRYLESVPDTPGQDSGHFRLDMRSALSSHPDLTSKGLLMPFLEKRDFTRLDVICSHIPPWFDRKFADLGLAYETLNVLPDHVTVRIIHSAFE